MAQGLRTGDFRKTQISYVLQKLSTIYEKPEVLRKVKGMRLDVYSPLLVHEIDGLLNLHL